jgi:hypothetical protein
VKALLVFGGTLLFLCSSAKAQSFDSNIPALPIEAQSAQLSSTLVEPDDPAKVHILPDAPIPILPSIQDGPFPCPAGVGKPCALLGGRLYFSDPSHMTEHDATWGKAMRNRLMVVGGILNIASAIADIEATQSCLRANTCREGNPIFGPSRARQYGLGIPITLADLSLAGYLKKHGNGNWAFAVIWGGTVMHAYLATRGASLASNSSSSKSNSLGRPQYGIKIRF